MPSPQLKDSEEKNANSILKLHNLLTPFFQRVSKCNFKKWNIGHWIKYSYMAEKSWNSDLPSLSTRH